MIIYFGLIIIIYIIFYLIPSFYYKWFVTDSFKTVRGKNSIALSFDDGIDRLYTGKILDLLARYNIKASFFIVANTIGDNLSLLKRMEDEGHNIGLHSLEHKDALLKGYFYTRKDFRQSIKIFNDCDIEPKYYRPPWGHINLFTLYYIRKYRLQLVLWNVIVGDWKDIPNSDPISDQVIKETKTGSIICLHDGRGVSGAPARTIEALEKIIPLFLDKGFNFVTMENLNGY